MFIVQTFTLYYDKVQDRISLTARSADGEIILLWLTQRLLNRMAQALIQWLNDELQAVMDRNALQELHSTEHGSDQSEQKPSPPAKAQAVHNPEPITNPKILPVLHAFEQRAAQAVHKPQKPVKSEAPLEDRLVRSVDLRSMPKGYVLILKWGEDRAARMAMDSTQLRQFMGMLYRSVGTAGWSRDRWPEWFSPEPSAGGASPHVMRH